jgi:hypothetical protein
MMAFRWMAAATLLLLTAPAVCPAQVEQPLYGRRLLILDTGDESRRKIVVRLTGLAVDAGAIDPVADGAALHVFNSAGTADSACMALPASGWRAGGTTLTYRDPGYANGPCKLVKVRTGRYVKALCRATRSPITYSLDEPAQASVGVRFLTGGDVYCADFGGSGPRDVPNRRFRAKNAAAPLGCPAPAAVCP